MGSSCVLVLVEDYFQLVGFFFELALLRVHLGEILLHSASAFEILSSLCSNMVLHKAPWSCLLSSCQDSVSKDLLVVQKHRLRLGLPVTCL